jgi:hypothetical protein
LHLQSLAPTPVARKIDVRQAAGKIIADTLSHDTKHVVLTPLSGIRVGKRRDHRPKKIFISYLMAYAREFHNKTQFRLISQGTVFACTVSLLCFAQRKNAKHV